MIRIYKKKVKTLENWNFALCHISVFAFSFKVIGEIQFKENDDTVDSQAVPYRICSTTKLTLLVAQREDQNLSAVGEQPWTASFSQHPAETR